ncbi:hypothetical protein M569_02957 [Genlisea aurea]|uniref:3'-5' exonuclease domain-containing protein n=1 Tax=Genlisea aurea TaxID=192259 RepID=S8CXT5_9LAMI|nr:hypothetical protein M569_02957 [Genlisea aurea]
MQNEAPAIHLVTSTGSAEFAHLTYALTHSSVIGLDAEWKPHHSLSAFPTVSLLQVACQLIDSRELPVFLVDLQSIRLTEAYDVLREMFVCPSVIKLGFRFKQDLVYLSSTFCEGGCGPGFDRVEPFIDIAAIYNILQPRRIPKQSCKGLATICKEVLGIFLAKELQCSDWSQRPLTEEQKIYAAEDARCLVEIFNVLHQKVVREGIPSLSQKKDQHSEVDTGLKHVLEHPNGCSTVMRATFCEPANMVHKAVVEPKNGSEIVDGVESMKPCDTSMQVDSYLLWIIRKHGDKLFLGDADRRPKSFKMKAKKPSGSAGKAPENLDDWQGPALWDSVSGGDGCPKFLCDVMVEGLAKHLRCVGIDSAIPVSTKPDARDLIEQARKEKRVILTRDLKLLKYGYLIGNQIYRIKSLLKNDQLVEVMETFKLKISEDQLMSRCSKCNGRFIQKALTSEEAVEAAKGLQVIPKCLFNRNLEFWQCEDCHQIYWEGTQYQNAVQKFIDVCKLNVM